MITENIDEEEEEKDCARLRLLVELAALSLLTHSHPLTHSVNKLTLRLTN